MTRYIFKNKKTRYDTVDEYETDDRSAFEDFIQAHTSDVLVRDIQRLGIRDRIACDSPDPVGDLADYICDGDYEDMAGGDLFADGMDVIERDFLEYGRDPDDLFDDCISIRDDDEEDTMNETEDKMETFRRKLTEAMKKGTGFMMVGTDDPKEAAEIMRIASEVLTAPKKVTTEVGYALGKNYEETEFDTDDEEELARRWWEYCKKNDLICVIQKEDEDEDEEDE